MKLNFGTISRCHGRGPGNMGTEGTPLDHYSFRPDIGGAASGKPGTRDTLPQHSPSLPHTSAVERINNSATSPTSPASPIPFRTDEYHERAAIMEIDGKMPVTMANELAAQWVELVEMYRLKSRMIGDR